MPSPPNWEPPKAMFAAFHVWVMEGTALASVMLYWGTDIVIGAEGANRPPNGMPRLTSGPSPPICPTGKVSV